MVSVDGLGGTARVLLTGMSGTGKSTVVAALAGRGFDAIDLDDPEWSEEVAVPGEELTGIGGGRDWVWREERVRRLLDRPADGPLFVSGCSPNQGLFYPHLDRIILLTAPVDVIVSRLETRTTNTFGKRPDEVKRVLRLKEEIEPRLRGGATLEIDTSVPLDWVIGQVLRHVGVAAG